MLAHVWSRHKRAPRVFNSVWPVPYNVRASVRRSTQVSSWGTARRIIRSFAQASDVVDPVSAEFESKS